MKKYYQLLFVSLLLLVFAEPASPTSNWWRSPNQPIEPTPSISSEPVQKSISPSPSTIEPNTPEQTQIRTYKPNYFVLKLGSYLPQSSDLDLFDNAFYGELGIGHYFNPNLAIEFGAGYTKSGASASGSIPGFGSGSASVDFTIIPVTLGLRGSITTGTFEPFATAGIGLYYTKADVSVNLTGLSGSAWENDTAFGFYFGLGGNFNITQNTYIGVEGKYFFATPSFEGVDVDIDGINLTANIGFRF